MKAFVLLFVSFWLLPINATEYSPLPESVYVSDSYKEEVPFDLDYLKPLWRQRVFAMISNGKLPIIDFESSFNPGKVDAREYAQNMDDNAIALTAFSPQVGQKKYRKQGALWHDGARRAVAVDPTRFIPVSTAGIYPAFTKEPDAFISETISRVEDENYPMMGEFEFRHYMSPRQHRRGEGFRDVSIAIDSDAGNQLFEFAHNSGVSFQIHYEIEDNLLQPLEQMLAQYPQAKVIWCHLAQVRYSDRSSDYGPDYVRKLIENNPNIYFDLAFGGYDSIYPGSGERHSRVWKSSGQVKQAWIDLITDYPYRFVAALDIGGDRISHVSKNTKKLRKFLSNLPQKSQAIVAYKSAWKLLFNEDI